MNEDANLVVGLVEPAEYFVQPKITGYRQLSEDDTALMNEVKAVGAAFEAVVLKVREHVKQQRFCSVSSGKNVAEELMRLDDAEPERWAAMGRTDAQTAVMKLCRAVAQPKS